MTPDTEGAGPLSHRMEALLAEAIARGLRFPIVASTVASNRSCVTVAYEQDSQIAVTMIAGHVARDGYRLPAFALLVDPTHRALLAFIGLDGARGVLYVGMTIE